MPSATLALEVKSDSTQLRVEQNVDIRVYPRLFRIAEPTDQFTIGDVHANALKLIHFLVKNGVLLLSEDQYNEIVGIYERSDKFEYAEADIRRFNGILANAPIRPCLVRIIGDEFADRGRRNRDDLIARILFRLRFSSVNTDLLVSNHSLLLLDAFSNNPPNYNNALGFLPPDQAQSLCNLETLAGSLAPEDNNDLSKMVEIGYKRRLKAISYSVNRKISPPQISIFTHAPVGLETIKSLAEFYDVVYDDSSVDKLCETIDEINNVVSGDILSGKFIKDFKAQFEAFDPRPRSNKLGNKPVPSTYPLLRLAWNRGRDYTCTDVVYDSELNVSNLPRKKSYFSNRYSLQFVHGHDGEGKPVRPDLDLPLINLDNELGRSGVDRAEYRAFYSNDQHGPRLHHGRTRVAASLRSFTEKHSMLWGLMKWIVIPATISAILVMTGGLGFIPVAVEVAFLVGTSVLSVVGNCTNMLLKKCMCVPRSDNQDNSNTLLLPQENGVAHSMNMSEEKRVGPSSARTSHTAPPSATSPWTAFSGARLAMIPVTNSVAALSVPARAFVITPPTADSTLRALSGMGASASTMASTRTTTSAAPSVFEMLASAPGTTLTLPAVPTRIPSLGRSS